MYKYLDCFVTVSDIELVDVVEVFVLSTPANNSSSISMELFFEGVYFIALKELVGRVAEKLLRCNIKGVNLLLSLQDKG